MALRDVVITILKSKGGILTAEEICKEIKSQDLFRKGDGTFPDTKYLLLRIPYYSEEFEFTVKLRK